MPNHFRSPMRLQSDRNINISNFIICVVCETVRVEYNPGDSFM